MAATLIVIGKTGQLARALVSQATLFGYDILAFGRDDCDLSASRAKIEEFAQKLPECDGILLAAAYTAVDAAQDDEVTAIQVNAVAPQVFAQLCAARNIPLVHVSTDYVFAGTGNTPLTPDMPTDPINIYGRTKLAGESAIIAAHRRAVILRTSWVFDGTGKNFMTTMLRLGQTRKSLSVVADQIGRPTYAGHLAFACLTALTALINDTKRGSAIYHVSGSGEAISWADFAKAIFAKTSDEREFEVSVTPIPSSEYPTPAKRPNYSVLDIQDFEGAFEMKLPDWQIGLDAAIDEWKHTRAPV